MIFQFLGWTTSLEPIWVGFFIWVSTMCAAGLTLLAVVSYLIKVTKGWVLLAVPAILFYCLYVAVYQQGNM